MVLHDIFDIKGGGERLALSLVDALKCDLGFGKHSPNSFELPPVNKFDLGLKLEFPGLKTWALSRLFEKETQFLNNYQNVIYSGIICPLAIKNHYKGGNFYYCHTPPRFVYDKYEHYMKNSYLPQRMMLQLLVSWYKPKYEESVALMDVVFANSKFVKARIKKYLNRDSVIIYPPCNLQNYSYQESQGYYLSTARFAPLKRVNEIINAFKKMPNKKLVLCSTGSELAKLKKLAENVDNISFTGQVSDASLTELISQCTATIYIPKDEDFGMSPVESMAAGKPVICSDHGGPTESVVDGETGFYISELNIQESLIDCVNRLDKNMANLMKSACEDRAEIFSEERFHKEIRKYTLN